MNGEALARELGAPKGEVNGGKTLPMMCDRHSALSILTREGWLFELKLDGVRIVADKRNKQVSLTYRRLRETTEGYPEIVKALETLPDERVVLDGEIVAFDEKGRPDFQLLAQRFTAKKAPRGVPVVYVVFDILAIGPYDIRGFPIEARKEILNRVIPAEGFADGRIRLHTTFEQGDALYRFCEEHDLEGVVAKKKGSVYRPGERTPEWLKIKREHDGEFVVVGWTENMGRLRALDIASVDPDDDTKLIYRGKVGSGLDAAMLIALLPQLRALKHDKQTSIGTYSAPDPGVVRFHARPELVVSVRYQLVSRVGNLRSPVFRGLRPDADLKECVLVVPKQ